MEKEEHQTTMENPKVDHSKHKNALMGGEGHRQRGFYINGAYS